MSKRKASPHPVRTLQVELERLRARVGLLESQQTARTVTSYEYGSVDEDTALLREVTADARRLLASRRAARDGVPGGEAADADSVIGQKLESVAALTSQLERAAFNSVDFSAKEDATSAPWWRHRTLRRWLGQALKLLPPALAGFLAGLAAQALGMGAS